MINLRYHIVSLVAVFLALAIGVLMGSTVLDRGTVALLEGSSAALRRSLDSHRAENLRLDSELEQWRVFGETLRPDLVAGELADRQVVLVDTDEVDDATREAVMQVVVEAGAEFAGRITVAADRVALESEEDRVELGRVLGVGKEEPEVLHRALIDRLSTRLLTPAVLPAEDGERAGDLLTDLRDRGFLTELDLPRGVDVEEPYPPSGTLFVVAGPGGERTEASELEPQELLVPLAGRLAVVSPQPVVAVERWDGPGAASWLSVLRGDDRVANRIASVDNVDQAPGQVALVMALAEQLAGNPPGHYGTGGGAVSLLPEGTPT